jgi:hypothetical protein
MDEYAHLDEFFETLRSKNVWNKIVTEIYGLRQAQEDGGWLNGKSFDEANLTERMEFDIYRTFASAELESIFQTHLLDSFAFPPITSSELRDIAIAQLSGASASEEFVVAIDRFCVCVSQATYYSNDDLNVKDVESDTGLGYWWGKSDDMELKSLVEDCKPIWRSNHGFWLTFVDKTVGFKAVVWGKLSDLALERVSSVIGRLLPSACNTLQLIHCNPLCKDTFHCVPFEVDLSGVSRDLVATENGFLSSILTHYFLPPAKKTSSIGQRLRNAVHLLVEADNQPNESISLALSFAAIEALVCEKSDGIVDELSRNVAALLQPIAIDRPSVIKAVKQLYNIRSKALHGDRLDDDRQSRWKARMLAAAVLRGVTEWMDHVVKVGAEPNRVEFLDELRTSAMTGHQMVGIDPRLSRLLPSENSA